MEDDAGVACALGEDLEAFGDGPAIARPIGIANVDHQRQLVADRDLGMGAQRAVLVVAGVGRAVVVEACLADRAHHLVGGERVDRGRVVVVEPGDVGRVLADRREDPLEPPRQLDRPRDSIRARGRRSASA